MTKYIVFKWSARKTFGPGYMGLDKLLQTASAGPSEESIMSITSQAIDGISTVTAYHSITLYYACMFTELKDIASS